MLHCFESGHAVMDQFGENIPLGLSPTFLLACFGTNQVVS